MVFLILFLFITLKHGVAFETLDVYAPGYLTSREDLNGYTNIDAKNDLVEVSQNGKIKYNELLSLLHNEKSNQVLLDHINKNDVESNNKADADKGNTRRSRRENENLDENQILSDNRTLKNDSEVVRRTKRESALKFLKNLLHDSNTTTSRPKSRSTIPIYLREAHHEINVNSTFTDILEDLIESIKILNKNLANLKLHVNENLGFIMIKMPIKEKEANDIKENQVNTTRIKRDTTDLNSTETNKNITFKNETIQVNVTENGHTITFINENLKPIVNVEAETDQSHDLNKSKRDANFTNTENNLNSSKLNNDSIVAAVTEADELTNGTVNSKLYNIARTINKPNELKIENSTNKQNIFKKENNETIEISSVNYDEKNDSLYENSLDDNAKSNITETRKSMNDNEELLLFIEKAYDEIQNMIRPINYVKEQYSTQMMYKIGYIIANLDTMDTTLKKLRKKLVLNRHVWDSNRLLKIYRKLNLSKQLVVHIMGYLDTYTRNQILLMQ